MTTARIGRDIVTLANVVIEGNTARIVKPEEQAPKAKPVPSTEPMYDSKLEAEYALVCQARKMAGEIVDYWHHPFSFKLPGERNSYTPDFLLWFTDGHVEIHETKGWSRNIREGIAKLKTAAGIMRWAQFVKVEKEDGKWSFLPMSAD